MKVNDNYQPKVRHDGYREIIQQNMAGNTWFSPLVWDQEEVYQPRYDNEGVQRMKYRHITSKRTIPYLHWEHCTFLTMIGRQYELWRYGNVHIHIEPHYSVSIRHWTDILTCYIQPEPVFVRGISAYELYVYANVAW